MRDRPTKVVSLSQAVREHVVPGAHLNFASTPSRSNAAIVELCRQFHSRRPNFTLSATGFHSLAHLLATERLGRCYISCFYGDNYPTPRPNPIYQALWEEGLRLEHWSLGTYVAALRAAAWGQPFALTQSLFGTTLGKQLAELQRYREEVLQDGSRLGLVSALVPDITFVHAPLADERGFAWFSPPHSEGFWGALAARRGVIITADRVATHPELRDRADLIPIPAHRVLAVCEVPFGAHPQPVHFAQPNARGFSYADDCEHYVRWRSWASRPETLSDFRSQVLQKEDAASAYRTFVGMSRLEALRAQADEHIQVQTRPEPTGESSSGLRAPLAGAGELAAAERQLILGARSLATRVREGQYHAVLAGIGQSFSVARLAKRILGGELEVELMVETGLCGFGNFGGKATDAFLLSQKNIAASERLTNVDNVLGALVCGGAASCIAVIGCAEVDTSGNLNSTMVDGRLLVGSGGACDIAAGAREVVVLARNSRLVAEVQHVTSIGSRVTTVVTESGVYQRQDQGWSLTQHSLSGAALPALALSNPWSEAGVDEASLASAVTELELAFILELRREQERTRAIEQQASQSREENLCA